MCERRGELQGGVAGMLKEEASGTIREYSLGSLEEGGFPRGYSFVHNFSQI